MQKLRTPLVSSLLSFIQGTRDEGARWLSPRWSGVANELLHAQSQACEGVSFKPFLTKAKPLLFNFSKVKLEKMKVRRKT